MYRGKRLPRIGGSIQTQFSHLRSSVIRRNERRDKRLDEKDGDLSNLWLSFRTKQETAPCIFFQFESFEVQNCSERGEI